MDVWTLLPDGVWWVLFGTGWLAAYGLFYWKHPCRGLLFQACRAWWPLFPWTLILALISSLPMLVESAKVGPELPWWVPAGDPSASVRADTAMRVVQEAVWSSFWSPWPERLMGWLGPLLLLAIGSLRARKILSSTGPIGRCAYLCLLAVAALFLVSMLLSASGWMPARLGPGSIFGRWIPATAPLLGAFALQFYLFIRAYFAGRGTRGAEALCQSAALKALSFWLPLLLVVGFLWSLATLPQDGGIPLVVRGIGVVLLLAGAALPCGFALINGGWLMRFLMGLRIPYREFDGFLGIVGLALAHLLPVGLVRHWLVHSWEPCWARTVAATAGHWLWHALALWIVAAFALFFAGALQPARKVTGRAHNPAPTGGVAPTPVRKKKKKSRKLPLPGKKAVVTKAPAKKKAKKKRRPAAKKKSG